MWTGSSARGDAWTAIHWRSLLLAPSIAAWLLLTVLPIWPHGGFDLAPLLVGAEVVASGHADDLYAHDPGVFNRVSAPTQRAAAQHIGYPGKLTPFIQAPLVAHMARPLAALGFDVARRIWLVVSTLAILTCLWLLERLYVPPDARSPLVRSGVMLALIPFAPVTYALLLGQTTPVVLLLVLCAMWAQRNDRPVVAGLLLAPAAFLKVTPVVFALLWLWRGPRRAAFVCLGAVALLGATSLLLDGPALHGRWLAFVGEIDSQMLVAHNNHSIKAFLGRMLVPFGAALDWQLLPPPPWIRGAQLAATFLLPLVALRVLKRAGAEASRPLAEALAGVWLVLAPSLSWTHYLVFLAPAFAVLAVQLRQRAEGLTALALGYALCCQPFVVDPAERELYASVTLAGPTLTALLLVALLFVVAQRAAARPPTSSPA
jgi:alpha-1,2-mannosyltransferase